MYGSTTGASGKARPLLFESGREWAYSYLRPGALSSTTRKFPTYHQALRAAIDDYCRHNTGWRLKNKAHTYRAAAMLLGLETEPPSKAEALRKMREERYREQHPQHRRTPF